MIDRIVSLKPINVLVDRSRDPDNAQGLVDLRPDDVFRTTDQRCTITRRGLRGYDVLAVCGNGSRPYSRAEKSAVKDFVENGGGLLLAAGVGEFTSESGRSPDDLAVNRPTGN